MAHEVGELLIGEVIKVKPYALFLKFDEGSQGLLHISEISNTYIRDIERFGAVGDKMRVKVLEVDPKNGYLRVSLKQVEREQAYSTHTNVHTKAVKKDEEGFRPLADRLPYWKKMTLDKIKQGEEDEINTK